MHATKPSSYALILDSCAQWALLAVCSSQGCHYESLLPSRDAASMFTKQLQELQSQRADLWQGIDSVIVGIGPGSYTGLRVAFATAAGIAYAKKIPLFAVSSLSACVSEEGRVLSCLDARSGGLYAQAFEGGKAQGPAFRLLKEHLKEQLSSWQKEGYLALSPDAHLLNQEWQNLAPSSNQSPFELRHANGLALFKGACHDSQVGSWQMGFSEIQICYLKEDEAVASRPTPS